MQVADTALGKAAVPIEGSGDFKSFTAVPFPVPATKSTVFSPWSLPRLNVDLLPRLNVQGITQLHTLFTHFHLEFTDRERHVENKGKFDDILGVKHTIRSIFASFTGVRGTVNHTFGFLRAKDDNVDTLIFVTGLRLDLADHSVVADAFVLTLSEDLALAGGIKALDTIEEVPLLRIALVEEELRVWKQLLPALAERSRIGWQHGADCKYLAQKGIPSHLGFGMDPLCQCVSSGADRSKTDSRPAGKASHDAQTWRISILVHVPAEMACSE